MPTVLISSSFVNGERRVESSWSIDELHARLETVTGIPPASQQLIFVSEQGEKVEQPPQGSKLADLHVADGWTIKVEDTRPAEEQLQLDENAKYEMSQEEYERRQNTVLQWKKQNKLGRFAENNAAAPVSKSGSSVGETSFGEINVDVGQECFVKLVSGKTVRGTVEFAGEVAELGVGPWIGVRLVSPDGKNNGTVKGIKLFEAPPNCGTLVRPANILPLTEDDEEI